jgi:hypothetical protein
MLAVCLVGGEVSGCCSTMSRPAKWSDEGAVNVLQLDGRYGVKLKEYLVGHEDGPAWLLVIASGLDHLGGDSLDDRLLGAAEVAAAAPLDAYDPG